MAACVGRISAELDLGLPTKRTKLEAPPPASKAVHYDSCSYLDSMETTDTTAYLHFESSFDSLASEATLLQCDELLLSERPRPKAIQASSSPAGAPRSSQSPSFCTTSPQQSVHAADAGLMIKNEAQRELEILPACNYMDRHAAEPLTPELRKKQVSRLVEVVARKQLQQETLFLAATYLDRFLSITQDVPTTMLPLIATACLSIASKQEEVEQLSAARWVAEAAESFQVGELTRVEHHILENLEWRLRTPTPYSFLHLYCYGLASCPAPTICVASYVVELALLEYSMLSFPYSTLAAAGIIIAHALTDAAFSLPALLHLAPHLDEQSLVACICRMVDLHTQACSAVAAAAVTGSIESACAPVLTKYSSQDWIQAASYPSMHAQQVLALLY